jgi:tetratricopeptide (TPR) repeat protein
MNLSTQAAIDILAKLDQNTWDFKQWRQLMILCFDQKDTDTLKTLQIVVEGLENLFESRKRKAKEEFDTALKSARETGRSSRDKLPNPVIDHVFLSERQKKAFQILARTPDDPKILQLVADFFSNDFNLPQTAQKLYERALQFNPADSNLEQVLKEMLERLQASPIQRPPPGQNVVEVVPSRFSKAKAADLIRKSGRIQLDITPTDAPAPPVPIYDKLLKQLSEIQTKLASFGPSPESAGMDLASIESQVKTLQTRLRVLERNKNSPLSSILSGEKGLGAIEDQISNLQKKLHLKEEAEPDAPASRVAETPPSKPEAPTSLVKTVPLPASLQAVPPPPPPPDATSEDLLHQCLVHIQEGALDQAFTTARQALTLECDSNLAWTTLTTLGFAFYEKRELDQAVAAYKQASELAPDAIESWFNLGVAHQENGQLEEALESYLRASAVDPNHPKVLCNLGAIYFQLFRHEEAERNLRSALEIKPDYARAWDNLAAALCAQERLEEAATACRQALKFKQEYPDAWFKLGVISFQREDYETAVQALEEVRRLSPRFSVAECYLAMALSRLGRVEEAVTVCEHFMSVDPGCELGWQAWNELGLAYFSSNAHEPASMAYQTSIDLKNDEPETWLNLGISFHQLGKMTDAIRCYSETVRLDPTHVRGWHNLGVAALDLHQPGEASKAFEKAAQLSPKDANAWYDYGISLEKEGRMEEAIQAFDRSLKLSPNTPKFPAPAPAI